MRHEWTWARIAVLLLGAAAASAEPSAPQRALAAKLLDAMQVERTMEQQFDAMRKTQAEAMQQMLAGQASPEAKQRMQKGFATITDMIKKELNWTAIKPQFVDLYASTFTADELNGLVGFYESPVGRAYVAKSPELMQRTMEVTSNRMEALMPRIQKILMEAIPQPEPPAADDHS
jgi:hypothetical protein